MTKITLTIKGRRQNCLSKIRHRKTPTLTIKGLMICCTNEETNTLEEKFDWGNALIDAAITSAVTFFSALGGGAVAGLSSINMLESAAVAAFSLSDPTCELKLFIKGNITALNLNKILASSCRRKILKALSEKRGITIMELVRIVNSTYNEVDRNLRILEREGLLTQQYIGHNRIICLNFKTEKTLVLLKLLKIRENSVDLKQLSRNLKRIMENTKENDNYTKH